VGLLEGAAQTLVVESLVAREVDLADLDLRVLVDDERYVDALLVCRVVVDAHLDLTVAVAFLREVALDEPRILVDHVVRKLGVAAQLQLLYKVLLLALAHTVELPAQDARTLFEKDLQVERVALDSGADLYVGEVFRSPQTLYGVGDELAGQIYRVALLQAGRRFEDVVVEVLHSVQVDLADVVELAVALAEYRRRCVEGNRIGRVRGGCLAVKSPASGVGAGCENMPRGAIGVGSECAQQQCRGGEYRKFRMFHLKHCYFLSVTRPKRRSRRAYSLSASSNCSSRKSGHSTFGK
jgi:hypothetical protein